MTDIFEFILSCLAAFFSLFDVPVLGVPLYVYIVVGVVLMAVAAFIAGRRK